MTEHRKKVHPVDCLHDMRIVVGPVLLTWSLGHGPWGMGGIMHLCYYVYYDYDVTTPGFFVFFHSSLSSRFRHEMLFEGNR